MNERVTENIVRTRLMRGDCEGAQIWEQSPDNRRIKRLLSDASKSGDGIGRPEFIVAFNERQDFLIVVECKADVARHQSAQCDKPADYAVDGALHYAKHLSREFNVLAIAVSGTDAHTLRVGHFWQFQGDRNAESAEGLGGNLLPVADYLTSYQNHGKLFGYDLNKLLRFSGVLNDRLHSLKIKESHRSLLISAILMALEEPGIAGSYKKTKPALLLKRIKDTMLHAMRDAGISRDTIKGIESSYSFMDASGKLTEERNLPDLMADVDKEIAQFNKNHKYHDVLGQVYIEFLRYSNSDKGLGIVLTPPHITELAVELTAVGKGHVLYDNCAGTGGFLISGMKQMISDAGGDSAEEQRIKENGIVGVEIQPDIVSMLCSNMFIHGDGKSNVIQGDCFNAAISEKIRKHYRPNIGFLNPPFKAQSTDTEEFAFVLNNMNALTAGGRCAALLPMKCALSQKGVRLALKQKLLENHTLDAVLSLPNELFHNSNAGVVTCMMLFTAHQPHPMGKKTWFAYCKNDGFVKKKPQGRIDYHNRWNSIRTKWINGHINREVIPGFSVMREVGADDEWCAEAYIETDYAIFLSDGKLLDTVKDYAAYRISHQIQVSDAPMRLDLRPVAAKQIALPDASEWKRFGLVDLFVISGSKTTPLDELVLYGAGKYPYITTQATDNGVAGYYGHFTEEGGVLAIDSAVLGYASYQPEHFSASDHVEKLTPRFAMSKYIALFLVAVLNGEQFRYNYGRKCSQQRLGQMTIKLPTDRNGKPDFALMEKYIQSLPFSSAI